MNSVSRMALGVALMFGGGAMVATAAAAAKRKQQEAPAQPGQPTFKFSKEERVALAPVQTAVTARDWATANAALPAAQAAAQGADARYAVARFQLEIGLGLQNVPMQAQAIDALIASGRVPTADLPLMYRNQAALALGANNYQKAEAAYARLLEISPSDSDALVNLARVKVDLRKPQEAVALLDRAIAAKKTTGQPVPENWYKYALKMAYDGKMAPQSVKIGRDLVAAYPTSENWRDALLIYRELAALDKPATLDVLRLMRVSKGLAGERDWYELAEALDTGGLPGEAKAVLEEGSRLRMVDLTKPVFRDLMRKASARISADRASLSGIEGRAMADASGTLALKTADAFFGYGDYSKAVALYRAALTKGSVDANLVNTRLGMALALAGSRAEAEAAFRAVAGPRAELAAYWLVWLAQRG